MPLVIITFFGFLIALGPRLYLNINVSVYKKKLS
ncbi:MAG: hypothetical protein ACJAYC_002069 [Halieaceae bacterium]|jgi:hypothetical protein